MLKVIGGIFLVVLAVILLLFVYIVVNGWKVSKKYVERTKDFISKNNIKNYQAFVFYGSNYLIYEKNQDMIWNYKPSTEAYIFVPRKQLLGCEIKLDDKTVYRTSLFDSKNDDQLSGLSLSEAEFAVSSMTDQNNSEVRYKEGRFIVYFDNEVESREILFFEDYKGYTMDNPKLKERYDYVMECCKYMEELIEV